MSHVTSGLTAPTPGLAKLVFMWPPTSCEPGGYFTIATVDGRVLGNVSRGTRLQSDIEPGAYRIMAWNAGREEVGAAPNAADTAVAQVEVVGGRTYFMRFAFGEWDMAGPRTVYVRSRKAGVYRTCSNDAALVALAPRSREWPNAEAWLGELTPIAADEASGPSLASEPSLRTTHAQLADFRWRKVSHEARELVEVRPDDGVIVGGK
jgi:hypothetical protein